jgi:hypothetical protein
MAEYGMTQAQACAGHNVRPETFSRWMNEPECEGMRERARYIANKNLVDQFKNAQFGEYKKYGWLLERLFHQFADPAKVAVQVNTQINNGDGAFLHASAEELAEARQRLDQTTALQQKRKTGAETTAELREILIEQIAERQRVVDYIDGGGTLDQEEQKQLYRQLEDESSNRRQEPIRTAVGHVVGAEQEHLGKPLAIEDSGTAEPVPGPKRPQPGPPATSMRSSDMDPLSGVAKPAEPPIPWSAKKPITGQLSTRQRWLAEERLRKGSEGKQPDLRD